MQDHESAGSPRLRRSALYLPASNARALRKAQSLPCDVVILDLEDAVAPDLKDAARGAVIAAIKQGGFGPRELVVRCNGLDTPWGADDVEQVARAAPDALLVPKIHGPADLARYEAMIAATGSNVALWAMIETCAAFLGLADIARYESRRFVGMVLGLNDLALEMRARLSTDRRIFLPMMAQAVVAARVGGRHILDGVYNAFGDPGGLAAQCREAVELGFDGKTLIHPAQIEICNDLFAPAPDEIERARGIVEAFARPEHAALGAINVGSAMVERLHLREARRVMALADAIARREG